MGRYVAAALALLGMLWLGSGVARAAPAARSAAGQSGARKVGRAQEVARAAVALKKLKLYHGETAGKWCPELHDAVRAFQKSRGLKITGRLNHDTRVALGLEEGKPKASRSQEDGAESTVQAP